MKRKITASATCVRPAFERVMIIGARSRGRRPSPGPGRVAPSRFTAHTAPCWFAWLLHAHLSRVQTAMPLRGPTTEADTEADTEVVPTPGSYRSRIEASVRSDPEPS